MPYALKVVIAACALLLGPAARAADPVKIGLVIPMSGPFAAYGKQIEHGVKLYLARNGDTFAGRKVELILKDDAPGTSGDVSKRRRRRRKNAFSTSRLRPTSRRSPPTRPRTS